MKFPLATVLARCRTLGARRSGRVALFALALSVFAAQLLLQQHTAQHDLLPGVHQVCEQCVSAEHSAPPPAVAAMPLLVLDGAAPARAFRPQLLARAPLTIRSRAPPVPA